MSVAMINHLCQGLVSPKITLRKKCCEDLFDILKKKVVIDGLDDEDDGEAWEHVFKSIKKGLYVEVNKLEETLGKGNKTSNSVTQVQKCSDLLMNVVNVANRKERKISFDVFNTYLKRCLEIATLRTYCLERCLYELSNSILCKKFYFGEITSQQWNELFAIMKNIHIENPETKALKSILLIVKNGPSHKMDRHYIKNEVDFFINICVKTNKQSPRWIQETTLELALEFSNLFEADSRHFCCKFGENVILDILNLYEPYRQQTDLQFLIMKFLFLQITIHHPNGAVEGEKMALAQSWTKWSRILREIYAMVNDIIIKKDNTFLRGATIGRRMDALFSKVAVEVYKQICMSEASKNISNTNTSSLEPLSKKRRCDIGIPSVFSNIEQYRDWTWINLLTELLRKYPDILSYEEFISILTFFASYQSECKSSDTRGHIFECLGILLKVEQILTDTDGFDIDKVNTNWTLVWDSAVRSLGLNQNQIETHFLIRELIKFNRSQIIQPLVNTFISRVVILSVDSLQTLSIMGQYCHFLDSTNHSSENPRFVLLNWILQTDKDNAYLHFDERITAEVLIGLVLKQWPINHHIECDNNKGNNLENVYAIRHLKSDLLTIKKPVGKDLTTNNHIVHNEAYGEMLKLLEQITCKVLSMRLKDIEIMFKTTFLYANLIDIMRDSNICNNGVEIIEMFNRFEPLLWEIITVSLKSDVNETKSPIFNYFVKLLEIDNNINHIIKTKIPTGLIEVLFDNLADEDDDDIEDYGKLEQDLKKITFKLENLKILCKYAVNAENEIQSKALSALVCYSVEPSNPVDYAVVMTIFKSMKESKGLIAVDVLTSIFSSLHKICMQLYKEHDAAFDVLTIILDLLPHIFASGDALTDQFMQLINPFFEKRNEYGPKISILIANCMGKIATIKLNDPEDDELVVNLPKLLCSPYFEVQVTTMNNLMLLFSENMTSPQLFMKEKNIFDNIISQLNQIFSTCDLSDADTVINLTSMTLYIFCSIIAINSNLRQKALFELLHFSFKHTFDIVDVQHCLQKTIQILTLPTIEVLLEKNLQYLLQHWNGHSFSLQNFPYVLLNCKTDTDFYKKYVSAIIPILITEEDNSIFERVCASIDRTADEVMQIAYPNILAKELVLRAIKESSEEFKVTPEDMKTEENTNSRINANLSRDICKLIIIGKIDEIIMHITHFIFDLKHFEKTFGIECNIHEPDTSYFSVQTYYEALQLLQMKAPEFGDNVIACLVTQLPSKLQQLILKMNYNIQKGTSIEDNILSFHRYVIFIQSIEPYIQPNNKLAPFIIRDVINTLLNLIKHNFEDDNLLNMLSAKYFAKFISKILPNCSEIFLDFLILTVSTLVPIANCENKIGNEVLLILKKLIIEYEDCLLEGLKILDPLPDNSRFKNLHAKLFHVRYGNTNCSLSMEIEYFLQVSDHIKKDGCRTEGLKHLLKQLKSKKTELCVLYEKLRQLNGSLNAESILHRFMCILVQLTASTNSDESVEASRCLGELGCSDLKTMVLKSEDKINDLIATPGAILISTILSLLNEHVVDENIDVCIVVSDALHKILSSYEGHQVISDIVNAKYLAPFVSNIKSKARSQVNISETIFMQFIKNSQLWSPTEKQSHHNWIIQLVCEVLRCFPGDCFYKLLIPVVKLKVEFAEKIFPVLINVILDIKVRTFEMISERIGEFFEKHWQMYWSGDIDNEFVQMQRASVQCMLNTVHFIRYQRNTSKTIKHSSRLELSLNYLHVALAAQFSSAHFSAILYAELWSQSSALDLQKETNDVSGNSILDIICENKPEAKQLRSILRQAYIDIGDNDALHYGQLLDPLDVEAHVNECMDLNRWDLVVLHYDIKTAHGEGHNDNRQLHALKNFALLDLATNYTQLKEPQYECLWRLNKWEEPLAPSVLKNGSFDCYHYLALRSFKEKDVTSFKNAISEARSSVIGSLQHASLESCKNVYMPLTRLQCLEELEDMFVACQNEQLTDLFGMWDVKNGINQNNFEYVEPVFAQRITMLDILFKNGNPEVKDVWIDIQLNLSEMARLEGNLNIALRVVTNLLKVDNLDANVKAKIMLEYSQIYWKIEKKSGTRALKHLLQTHTEDSKIRSTALKLYGSWMVELKSDSSQNIISNYFVKSIEMLNKVQANKDTDAFYEAREILANFADQLYQEILKHTKSTVFQGKIQSMEKLQQSAAKMKSASNSKALDVKRAIVVYERQSEIDKAEIDNTYKEKDRYLDLAIKYYLFNLQFSDRNNIHMFRIISLWLENRNNTALTQTIISCLPKLATYKFLPILPQLIPHITNSSNADCFSKHINQLIERCAREHPHHAIPIILSVANSNKDDIYTDTSASTETNEPRIIGAQNLMDTLKRDTGLQNMILQMEKVADALIQLAYYENYVAADLKRPIKIPLSYKIQSIVNFEDTIVPTLNLPVQKGRNYNVIGIHKFSKDFKLVGGLNAPKQIQCTGTDGVVRNQLIKGKDDLRQDAVMQQVFTIMNGIFAANKTTQNFLIRTYKIQALSKRSGILEWVDNSMPIGEYLVGKNGAHRIYNPLDLPAEKCRDEFGKAKNSNKDVKLKKYLKICERFRPAFHKFFETTFLQPTEWYERRIAYTHSVATTSMCGYILGLGDRHVNNILIDKNTAEVIHIDFGIAFEQGKVLPTPETVPFRLTRDIEAGMGICGVEGVFRRSCEKTMEVLRNNAITVITILEVLLYDPLYAWTITPAQAYSRQLDLEDGEPIAFSNEDSAELNVTAERALNRLRLKLQGTEYGAFTSVEGQVGRLIQEAREPANLCRLFYGWQPYL